MQKNNSFFVYFPVPKLLKMKAVGLDITGQTIKFIDFINKKNGLELGDFIEEKIPANILKSKDQSKLKNTLTSLKKKYNLNFIRLAISEDSSYLFRIILSNIKKREIRKSIELQLEEYVPIPVNDSIFDYQIIKEEKNKIEAMVTVLPKDVVNNYLKIFKEVGLIPISLENEAQAVARAVIPREKKGTFMVVDFGRTTTGIYIINNGIVRFTSTIKIGGDNLTNSLKKSLKIDFKEAEKIKIKKGISRKEENKKIFTILLPIISTLRDEINKNYIYWHTHGIYGKGENRKIDKIKKIILCGGSSNLKGLEEYIAASMKVDTDTANVWVNVNSFDKYIPEIKFQDSLRYTTAIGLSLYEENN